MAHLISYDFHPGLPIKVFSVWLGKKSLTYRSADHLKARGNVDPTAFGQASFSLQQGIKFVHLIHSQRKKSTICTVLHGDSMA